MLEFSWMLLFAMFYDFHDEPALPMPNDCPFDSSMIVQNCTTGICVYEPYNVENQPYALGSCGLVDESERTCVNNDDCMDAFGVRDVYALCYFNKCVIELTGKPAEYMCRSGSSCSRGCVIRPSPLDNYASAVIGILCTRQ
jgi:hypothetical protein